MDDHLDTIVECEETASAKAVPHTHTHKAKQSLRQPCETQLLLPSERALGCLCTTQEFQANPPGAGLVTHRRTVQVSQIKVAELKVLQRPHTTK